jgi:hypothetical protein
MLDLLLARTPSTLRQRLASAASSSERVSEHCSRYGVLEKSLLTRWFVAGIGGLTCAVELMLAGHGPVRGFLSKFVRKRLMGHFTQVTVYESVAKFARLGDTIGERASSIPCAIR